MNPIGKYIKKENIFVVEEKFFSKEQFYNYLVNKCIELKIIDEEEKDYLYENIIKQDKQGGFSIGEGIAIPHIRLKKLDTPIILFFYLIKAIDFDSIDKIKVNSIVFSIIPENDTMFSIIFHSSIIKFLQKHSMKEIFEQDPQNFKENFFNKLCEFLNSL